MSSVRPTSYRRRAMSLVALLAVASTSVALLPEAFAASGNRIDACLLQGTNRLWRMSTSGSIDCLGDGWHAVWYEYPDSGAQGARGTVGPRGARGPRGERGAQGERGVKGANGTDGEDGRDGQDGATGPVGARGPVGEVGSMATYIVATPCAACGDNIDGVRTGSTATCDKGDVALSGGFLTDGIISASSILGGDKPVGWQAPAITDTQSEGGLGSRAQVICLDTPPMHKTSG